VAMSWQLKANRDRNKPMMKMNREPLEGALAARDRIQAVSDEIRARAGLPPVPESPHMMRVRGRLGELVAKDAGKRKRKPSRATSAAAAASSGSPRDALTPDALEAWRQQHEREAEEIRSAAVAMFRERVAGATRIGKALGVKRQRVYQLADAAA
jgi:hypothetical protein